MIKNNNPKVRKKKKKKQEHRTLRNAGGNFWMVDVYPNIRVLFSFKG